MNRFPFFATLIALIAVVILMVRLGRVEKELRTMKQAGAAATAAATPEVAVYMERIQAFNNKLWSAGKAGNLPLAEFYRHEMKEAMEELAKAGIVDDGVNVSEEMERHGIRTLDAMKAELRTNGLAHFDQLHATLINTCNTCHAACGKPYIRVKSPTYTRYDDQDFFPVH